MQMHNTLDTHVRILLRAYLDVRVCTKARYLGRTRAKCYPCGSGRDIVTQDFALTPRTYAHMHADTQLDADAQHPQLGIRSLGTHTYGHADRCRQQCAKIVRYGGWGILD